VETNTEQAEPNQNVIT